MLAGVTKGGNMALVNQLLLLVFSVILWLLFLGYRMVITAFIIGIPVGVVFAIALWWCPAIIKAENYSHWFWAWGLLTLISFVWTYRPTTPDNPYRRYIGLSGLVDKVVDHFIAWIGTIKYFTQPLSAVVDPGAYKIKGEEVRQLIDNKEFLKPGDILLRGFDGYLDGVMIGLSGNAKSKAAHFSHAALYLGELTDSADKEIVARRLQVMDEQGQWRDANEAEKSSVRNNHFYYQSGRQQVVHAMTKGVFTEDLLSFVRCDFLAVIRLSEEIVLTEEERRNFMPLIVNLPEDASVIRDRLLAGEAVSREEVIKIVRLSALGKIGSCYDFQFNDGMTHNRFSCSEFVYYCFKSVHAFIGLQLVRHGFLKILFVRITITPGDVFEAAEQSNKLDVVWKSRSLGA
jgi:hypothetical protein